MKTPRVFCWSCLSGGEEDAVLVNDNSGAEEADGSEQGDDRGD